MKVSKITAVSRMITGLAVMRRGWQQRSQVAVQTSATLSRRHIVLLPYSVGTLAAAAPSRRRMASATPDVVQHQSAVMDSVYGTYSGPGWAPAPFGRTAPRYLWTDAFGVCNYLTLYHSTQEQRYLQQAQALVAAVHSCLGHQQGSGPAGASSHEWLPGASAQHPTAGGLRIGKPHPEGHPDGDGQYFHYLTKWAFALAALTAATDDTTYLGWGVEMMQRIHPAFVYGGGSGPKRMHWKMSTDLSRAAVASMGNLDPYDGLVTCSLLQQAAQKTGLGGGSAVLSAEIEDMRDIVQARYHRYSSDDPLDLGESLWLSHWQLGAADWADHVSQVSLTSLDSLWAEGYFEQPLQWRLAFREFGTSLGLQAVMSTGASLAPVPGCGETWRRRVQGIHAAWAKALTTRDCDITPVMYAASINPGVWLRENWEFNHK